MLTPLGQIWMEILSVVSFNWIYLLNLIESYCNKNSLFIKSENLILYVVIFFSHTLTFYSFKVSRWKLLGQHRENVYLNYFICILSRFRVLYLLSWEFEQSEIHWRYTAIMLGHLQHHVQFRWYKGNYLNTDHLSVNMYIITIDGLTLSFNINFPLVAPEKTETISAYFWAFCNKNKQTKNNRKTTIERS